VTHRRSGLTHSPWLIAISLLMIVLILTGAWLFVGRWPDPTEPALPAAVKAKATSTSTRPPLASPPLAVMTIAPSLSSVPPTSLALNSIALPTPSWQRLSVPPDAELQAAIAVMSLEDKVAQLLIIGFNGQSVGESPELELMVGQQHVGGVILLEPNAHDPVQIKRLTTELQALATTSGARIPLFISSNHEGGIVVRISDGVTGFPGNMAVAATGQLEYANVAAAYAAQELRAMGINMNLAPVVDVNDNPLNPVIGARSFGSTPVLVAEYSRMSVRGSQDFGVIAVAKHFPGHGSVAVDSHGDLPVITDSRDDLERRALGPFKAAIQQGVAAIMTAHIAVPALDESGRPATLSSQILTGLLRHDLKFDGLIMTDSLGMGAVSAGRGQPQAAVEAVQAGADIVLSTGPLDAELGIIRALVAAVRSGQIPVEQIDQSVLRVLRVKHAFGLFDQPIVGDLSAVGSPEHQAAANEIARRSVTVLRDSQKLLPLGPSVKRLLIISPIDLPPSTDGNSTLLAELLRAQGYEVTELKLDLDAGSSRDAIRAQARAQAAAYDAVIFGEWELIKREINTQDHWQAQLMSELSTLNSNFIVIAWHNPAAILRSPPLAAVLTDYGDTRAQVAAVVEALTGSLVPTGRLPMDLSTTLSPP